MLEGGGRKSLAIAEALAALMAKAKEDKEPIECQLMMHNGLSCEGVIKAMAGDRPVGDRVYICKVVVAPQGARGETDPTKLRYYDMYFLDADVFAINVKTEAPKIWSA